MASIYDVQNIKKSNGNNFHTLKIKMEFLLHQKDLWEIASRELLPLEVEFGKVVPKGSILKHYLFMKKDEFIHETIILNVDSSLLHHVTCAKIAKDAWDNLCATIQI
jgi:hypothetical protein